AWEAALQCTLHNVAGALAVSALAKKDDEDLHYADHRILRLARYFGSLRHCETSLSSARSFLLDATASIWQTLLEQAKLRSSEEGIDLIARAPTAAEDAPRLD